MLVQSLGGWFHWRIVAELASDILAMESVIYVIVNVESWRIWDWFLRAGFINILNPIFILRRQVVVPNIANYLLRHLVCCALNNVRVLVELQNLLVSIRHNIGVQWLDHFLHRVLSVFHDSVMPIFSHVVLFALEPIGKLLALAGFVDWARNAVLRLNIVWMKRI
jgi:hypothetical protein